MTLLEIQDLRSKLRELEAEPRFQELQREHFHVDPVEAVQHLAEKVTEMEAQLGARVRRRYDRIAGRLDRVVVPVIDGVCYGCFTSIATAVAVDPKARPDLRNCENCGRFIYVLT